MSFARPVDDPLVEDYNHPLFVFVLSILVTFHACSGEASGRIGRVEERPYVVLVNADRSCALNRELRRRADLRLFGPVGWLK